MYERMPLEISFPLRMKKEVRISKYSDNTAEGSLENTSPSSSCFTLFCLVYEIFSMIPIHVLSVAKKKHLIKPKYM